MNKLILMLLIVFVGCGPGSKKEDESGKPTQVTINFLKWYKSNYDKLNPLLLGEYVRNDTTTIFSIDTVRTQEYIEHFRRSGYVSSEYLSYWGKYLRDAERKYKTEAGVEIASEFEFDWVLQTQEVDEVLEKIDNPKVISEQIMNDKSEVKISLSTNLLFSLSKRNSTWVIDKVVNLGFEE